MLYSFYSALKVKKYCFSQNKKILLKGKEEQNESPPLDAYSNLKYAKIPFIGRLALPPPMPPSSGE